MSDKTVIQCDLLLSIVCIPYDFMPPFYRVHSVHSVTAEYARGVGLIEKSSYTLSVQFLNRVSYVTDLVRERNLLSNLSRCLLETMRGASFVPGSPGAPRPAGASLDMMNDLNGRMRASSSLTIALMGLLGFFSVDDVDDEENIARLDMEMDDIFHNLFGGAGGGGDSRHHGRSCIAKESSNDGDVHENLLARTRALIPPTLDPSHTVLTNRRYSVCISDLKCVLNVNGMARHIASLPIDREHPSAVQRGGIDQLSIRPRDNNCALDDWINVSVYL